jgi:protein TonB
MEKVLIISAGFVAFIALLQFGIKWMFDSPAFQLSLANNELPATLNKKYSYADMKQYEGIFLRVGLAVTIIYCIILFSLLFYYKKEVVINYGSGIEEIDIIEAPTTYIEKKVVPPALKPEIKTPEVKIVLVDKDIVETKEDKIITDEIDENKSIEFVSTNNKVNIEEEEIIENLPFVLVQDKPEFPGGEAALLDYLSKIKFPPFALENQIEGTVTIGFTIDKTGKVTDVKILRSPDKNLNASALNHVKNMPLWSPGKQRGKPVSVTYAVPIKFVLRN